MDNFIVSARKYRPATFDSVVGQGHITSTLKNAISRNQLAHAYLFCGPRGVGKTTCARIFAKAINCTSPKGSEACGECESCRSFNEGRSFSIHELDAASNNSVDDIRTLTDQVRIPPQVGRYSVYIIDEVHMLSASAFNAFLKTLEEPPAHAVFILATTEKHKIIPTILSRCQIYDFNRIRVEDSVEYLKHIASQEGVTADDESLNLIAHKADGGMRDALSMFDKAVAFCGASLGFKEVARTLNVLDYDTYFTMTDHVGGGDYKSALVLFDEVLRKGFSGLTFVSGFSSHMRDLLMCKDPNTLPLLEVTGSLLDRYKQQSAQYDTGFLFNAISILSGVDNTFKAATNQRLHVELGLMKLCALAQKKTDVTNGEASLPPLVKSTSSDQQADNKDNVTHGARPGVAGGNAAQTGAHESAAVGKSENPVAAPTVAATTEAPGSGNGTSASIEKPASQATATTIDTPKAGTTAEAVSQSPDGKTNSTYNTPASLKNPAEETNSGNSPSPAPPSGNGRGLSGVSISDILRNNGARTSQSEGAAPVAAEVRVDPQSEEKINGAKGEFLTQLARKRPRISTALENMAVTGNRISATVASEVLREDILLHQKEILGMLARLGGVEGPIEIEIDVKEDTGAVRPIRPEDKLEHLRAKNPLLDELRRELNLEME